MRGSDVSHICNVSRKWNEVDWEFKVGCEVHSEFKASLGYLRPCLQKLEIDPTERMGNEGITDTRTEKLGLMSCGLGRGHSSNIPEIQHVYSIEHQPGGRLANL